jgi:hypothetical protein
MLIRVGYDGPEQPHLTQAVPVRVLYVESMPPSPLSPPRLVAARRSVNANLTPAQDVMRPSGLSRGECLRQIR